MTLGQVKDVLARRVVVLGTVSGWVTQRPKKNASDHPPLPPEHDERPPNVFPHARHERPRPLLCSRV